MGRREECLARSPYERSKQSYGSVKHTKDGVHCMSINSDLLAHWQFNGDCRDSSGNGNHGTNAAPTYRLLAATARPAEQPDLTGGLPA